MEGVRRVLTRSDSAENRPDAMACNTSGLTRVVSTNQVAPNSQRPSTRCFAGIRMRSNAMSISQMCRQRSGKQAIRSPNILGNQHFGQVDGLLVAGHFKSLLLLLQSNSSPYRGSC
jgi:hypothetical protein